MSHLLFGLLVYTCTINKDDVNGRGVAPATISINSDGFVEGGFALALFGYTMMSLTLSGLLVHTCTINTDDVKKVSHSNSF